jgi:hypothetical protein
MLSSMRRSRGVYTDLIIEIVYSRGCVTKSVLVNIIAEKLKKPKNTVRNNVSKRLVLLVRRGVIERPVLGVYCKPGFRRGE